MKSFLTLLILFSLSSWAQAVIVAKIDGVPGDSNIQGYPASEGWFIVNTFSLAVDRELVESEPGGAGPRVGLGQIEAIELSKPLDKGSAKLMQLAVTGAASATAEIRFLVFPPSGGGGQTPDPIAYLVYKLEGCYVKSWGTSGDEYDRPEEELSLIFNKFAFAYYHSDNGLQHTQSGTFGWDLVRETAWSAQFTSKPPTGDQ